MKKIMFKLALMGKDSLIRAQKQFLTYSILIFLMLLSASAWGQQDSIYVNFDDVDISLTPFNCTYEKAENPDKSGINTSHFVGKIISSGYSTWEGIYNPIPFEKIKFSERYIFKVKVYAPRISVVMLKLEHSEDKNKNPLELTAVTTKVGEWEELSFNFKDATSNFYDRIVLFFDYGGINDGEEWYFDDIVLGKPKIRKPIVTLPALFNNNMVLQQNMEAHIWGWAPPAETVVIQASWGETTTAIADQNWNWSTKLQTPEASPGEAPKYSITVTGTDSTIVLENVLIGDVWLCSGQSNMEMGLVPTQETPGILNYEDEIAAANYPNIRLFTAFRNAKKTPQDDCHGYWNECSPATVASFSATAYFFARELYNDSDINVPIGLIHASYGGSSCQAWTKREVLAADPELKTRYLDPYDANPNQDEIQERPTLLYNGMIAPLIPFAIKGAIWYQGEGNQGDGDIYQKLCTAMLEDWRADWGQGNFPFYYIQVAPFIWDSSLPEPRYAGLREAQFNMLSVQNTGMVVTLDIGDPYNIHPPNKQDVGKRLALWAKAKTYGQDIVYSGPFYETMAIEGDKIRISFQSETSGSGLAVKDGAELTHFYIAGNDKNFYNATAVIEGNEILVSSSDVPNPVAVRYAFSNAPEPNLMNLEGLPAAPFRTDDWGDATVVTSLMAFEEENSYPLDYKLYPNPVNNILHINNASDIEKISIFNIVGQTIISRKCANSSIVKINVSGFAAGVYFIKLTQIKGTPMIHRFLKY